MRWWTFLRQHSQRPAHWWQAVTPTYWRQANRERLASIQEETKRVPCGHCTTRQFITDGTVVRQDVQITVGREALTR